MPQRSTMRPPSVWDEIDQAIGSSIPAPARASSVWDDIDRELSAVPPPPVAPAMPRPQRPATAFDVSQRPGVAPSPIDRGPVSVLDRLGYTPQPLASAAPPVHVPTGPSLQEVVKAKKSGPGRTVESIGVDGMGTQTALDARARVPETLERLKTSGVGFAPAHDVQRLERLTPAHLTEQQDIEQTIRAVTPRRPMAPSPVPAEPPTLAGEAARGLVSGLVAQPAEGLTALGVWSGVIDPEVLRNVQRTNRELAPAVTASVMDNPAGTLGNPMWWASTGGQVAGSILSLASAGGIGMKIAGKAGMALGLSEQALTKVVPLGGAAFAAVAEAGLGGSLAYSEAVEAGATPEQAGQAAADVIKLNAPFIFVTGLPLFNAPTKSLIVNGLVNALSEGGQEAGQQEIANRAAQQAYDVGRDPHAGVADAAIVGGLAGPVAGFALSRGQQPARRVEQPGAIAPMAPPPQPPGPPVAGAAGVRPPGSSPVVPSAPPPVAAAPELPVQGPKVQVSGPESQVPSPDPLVQAIDTALAETALPGGTQSRSAATATLGEQMVQTDTASPTGVSLPPVRPTFDPDEQIDMSDPVAAARRMLMENPRLIAQAAALGARGAASRRPAPPREPAADVPTTTDPLVKPAEGETPPHVVPPAPAAEGSKPPLEDIDQREQQIADFEAGKVDLGPLPSEPTPPDVRAAVETSKAEYVAFLKGAIAKAEQAGNPTQVARLRETLRDVESGDMARRQGVREDHQIIEGVFDILPTQSDIAPRGKTSPRATAAAPLTKPAGSDAPKAQIPVTPRTHEAVSGWTGSFEKGRFTRTGGQTLTIRDTGNGTYGAEVSRAVRETPQRKGTNLNLEPAVVLRYEDARPLRIAGTTRLTREQIEQYIADNPAPVAPRAPAAAVDTAEAGAADQAWTAEAWKGKPPRDMTAAFVEKTWGLFGHGDMIDAVLRSTWRGAKTQSQQKEGIARWIAKTQRELAEVEAKERTDWGDTGRPTETPKPQIPVTPPQATPATVTVNPARRTVVVSFPSPPSDVIRNNLGKSGFRWDKGSKAWLRKAPTGMSMDTLGEIARGIAGLPAVAKGQIPVTPRTEVDSTADGGAQSTDADTQSGDAGAGSLDTGTGWRKPQRRARRRPQGPRVDPVSAAAEEHWPVALREARTTGYDGTDETLLAIYQDRVQSVRNYLAIRNDGIQQHGTQRLLDAIIRLGGLRPFGKSHVLGAPTLKDRGEYESMIAGFRRQGIFGAKSIFRNDGLPIDRLLQDLQGSGEHPDLDGYTDHDLNNRLDRIARGLEDDAETTITREDAINLLDAAAGVRPGERWWMEGIIEPDIDGLAANADEGGDASFDPSTFEETQPADKFHGIVSEITSILPAELKPLNQQEMNGARSAQTHSGLSEREWAKTIDLSEPIDASIYSDGEIKLQDGHHRFLAASILNVPLKVTLQAINTKADVLAATIARVHEQLAAAEPKSDTLDTGEEQGRLPGAVGAVRDANTATPEFDAPFSLTSEVSRGPNGQQGSLLDQPPTPKPTIPVTPRPSTPRGSSGGSSGNASMGGYASVGKVGPRGPLFTPPTAPVNPSKLHPIEVPELVELARELIATPEVVKKFRKEGKLGDFTGTEDTRHGRIRLHANLFKAGQEHQLAATLAHEIGHLGDWLPNYTLKRGNLLGRLRSLTGFLKGKYTASDGITVTNKEVRDELLALSKLWRPWDEATSSKSFNAYRRSGKELYADAISVLLNNPGLLEREAPIFFEEFFAELDRKPEVKRAYDELMDLYSGSRDELISRRRGRVQAGALLGEQKALDAHRAKIAEREAIQGSLWTKLRIEFYDKNTPVNDFVTAAKKRGVVVPEDEDPRFFLKERNYIGGKMKAAGEEFVQPIRVALRDVDIPWMSLHESLMYDRIESGDRSEYANPEGLSPTSAAELHTALKAALTPSQVRVLEKAKRDLRGWVKSVSREAHAAGLLTDAQMKTIEGNDFYAPFRVVEHIEDEVSWRIYHQTGTLKSIGNTADAAILKTMATIRAIERQKMLVATFTFMGQHAPAGAIAQAEERWNGKTHVPVEPQLQSGTELVRYYEKGKLRGKIVDTVVANSLNNLSVGQNWTIVRALSFVNSHWFRPAFTTFNLAFQTKNFARDFQRTWANRPDTTFGEILKSPAIMAKHYARGMPLARVRAFGPKAHPTAKQAQAHRDLIAAEKAGILGLTWNDMMRGRDVADTEIEQILGKIGIGPASILPRPRGIVATPVTGILRVGRFIEELGNFIETLPKAAGIAEYAGDGAIADISPAQRAYVREKMGSPDFRAGGTHTPISNNALLFSNAFLHGTGSDIEAALGKAGPGARGPGGRGYGPGVGPDGPSTAFGWWWKTAMLNVAPKMAMFAAMYLAGSGDDDDKDGWLATMRRKLRAVSEYDMTNYLPIPWSIDEKGNVTYLRLQQSDTGRLVGGLTWKALQFARGDKAAMTSAAQVFDYMSGNVPGLAPVLTGISDVVQFSTSGNVYQPFQNRMLLTDDEARDTNRWRKAKKFFGYEFQQLGGGVVWKFYPGEARPRAQTTAQKILEFPVLSSLSGGWVKVSTAGSAEKLREAGAAVQATQSTERLDDRDAINDAIRAHKKLPVYKQTEQAKFDTAKAIAKRLYPNTASEDQEELIKKFAKKFEMGLVRGDADPLTDVVMSATSNAQKVAVILKAKKDMTPQQYRAWFTEAVKHRIVSENVAAELSRQTQIPVTPRPTVH